MHLFLLPDAEIKDMCAGPIFLSQGLTGASSAGITGVCCHSQTIPRYVAPHPSALYVTCAHRRFCPAQRALRPWVSLRILRIAPPLSLLRLSSLRPPLVPLLTQIRVRWIKSTSGVPTAQLCSALPAVLTLQCPPFSTTV